MIIFAMIVISFLPWVLSLLIGNHVIFSPSALGYVCSDARGTVSRKMNMIAKHKGYISIFTLVFIYNIIFKILLLI